MPVAHSKRTSHERVCTAKPRGKSVAGPPTEQQRMMIQEDSGDRRQPLLEELAKYIDDEHVAKKVSAFLEIERLNAQIRDRGTTGHSEPDTQKYSALLVARMDAFLELTDLMNGDFCRTRGESPHGSSPMDEFKSKKAN